MMDINFYFMWEGFFGVLWMPRNTILIFNIYGKMLFFLS